jgi:hypothetical protein
MYFLNDNNISIFEIYNGSTGRITIPPEVEIDPEFVLMGEQNIFLMAENRLLIFELID